MFYNSTRLLLYVPLKFRRAVYMQKNNSVPTVVQKGGRGWVEPAPWILILIRQVKIILQVEDNPQLALHNKIFLFVVTSYDVARRHYICHHLGFAILDFTIFSEGHEIKWIDRTMIQKEKVQIMQ